jgi:hypothetical protein
MFLTYLILVVALSLSAVAAFYSIIGLTVIFAAAAVPVIIMGTVLEVAKLVVTVWLHEYWSRVRLLMKLYLVPAVAILMFITSMGIFGFLSRAHIEQTSAGVESQAQIERLTREIARQTELAARAETRFQQMQTTGIGADVNVQAQIDAEQTRIDTAYQRVQPSIDEQNRIIESQTRLYTDQLERIDRQLETLQGYIDSGDVARAQSMVGTRADGQWGPATAATVRNWQATRNQERQALVAQLKDLDTNNATVRTAREEIQRLRQGVETQIAESNRLVNRLRDQLGQANAADTDAALKEQQELVRAANLEVDQLTQQRYQLEIDYRKLEAEVGPVKYIAEFVYGEQADKNMLEKAVRWVIVIIVAVFDPLAVMMLLAFTESRAWHRAEQRLPVKPLIPNQPASVIKNVRMPRVFRRRKDTSFVSNTVDTTASTAVANYSSSVIDPEPTTAPPVVAEKTNLPTVSFGPAWPDNPVKGYMFLRTDYVPTKLFKFNGNKWIEVDKDLTDGYVTNSSYIDFLVKKIESREYDPELLNDAELDEIEKRLKTGDQ